MNLLPLTTQGVHDKWTEIYTLPNDKLLQQANAIGKDFRAWLRVNFELTQDQKNYLSTLDDTVVTYFGQQCEICFRHRLPINLIYPQAPALSARGKWLELIASLVIAATGTGELMITGSITFQIKYLSHNA